jgi:putative oxidoreductase
VKVMAIKFIHNGYLHLAVRLFIGALFLYAAVPDILDTLGFASAIYNYQLFPSSIIGISAVFVPWVEVLAGLALVFGVKVRGASLLVSLLVMVFISLAAISTIRGLDIDCGCFSGVERTAGWLAIVEDLVLLGCALVIFFFDSARISLASLIKKISSSRTAEKGAL